MIFHRLSKLFDNNQNLSHKVAVRGGEQINFAHLRKDVAAFINQYNNCRAALICEDSYNFLVGFLGLVYGNSSFIPSSKDHTNIAGILREECSVIINDDTILGLAESGAGIPDIDANRLCIDFFTSGSTGTPKRVTKSLAMFEREIAIIDNVLSQKPGTVYATVPHYHLYGVTFKLLWPLASQHPFDTSTDIFFEDILNKITPNSLIISSPVHLSRLDGIDIKIEREKYPAQILSAGSKLSYENSSKIKEMFNIYPTEIFGSTETGAIAFRSVSKENQPLTALPGIQVEKDINGCMRILSPILDSTTWYNSNDLISLTAAGFHALGRIDGITKIEGRRVSLKMVEEALLDIGYVKDAAVFVSPNKPEYLATSIVLNNEGNKLLLELGNFRFSRLLRTELAKKLERTSIPKLWRFIDKLPVNSLGKRNFEELS